MTIHVCIQYRDIESHIHKTFTSIIKQNDVMIPSRATLEKRVSHLFNTFTCACGCANKSLSYIEQSDRGIPYLPEGDEKGLLHYKAEIEIRPEQFPHT